MNNAFSENLKKLRHKLNKSQTEMALDLDLSINGYANYELGKRYPTAETLYKATQMWGINLHWLLTGHGSMFNSNSLQKVNNYCVLDNFKKCNNRIIQIQLKHNLSNSDMAKLLDISSSLYARICAGKIEPDIKVLNKIKQNFDVDMDWLMYGETEFNEIQKVSDTYNNMPPLTPEQYKKLLKILSDL